MKRNALLMLLALLLVIVSWSVGRAQATVADFELTIDAPRGTVVVTCHRGCDWRGLAKDAPDFTQPYFGRSNDSQFRRTRQNVLRLQRAALQRTLQRSWG